MVEIGFVMGADPAVIEVRLDAAVGILEREDLAGASIYIGVRARERAVARHLTAQPVDAAVVVGATAAIITIVAVVIAIGIHGVVDAARHIGERAEVVVEGMIFLHDDDDVLQVLQRR